jgi:hypothetical protein
MTIPYQARYKSAPNNPWKKRDALPEEKPHARVRVRKYINTWKNVFPVSTTKALKPIVAFLLWTSSALYKTRQDGLGYKEQDEPKIKNRTDKAGYHDEPPKKEQQKTPSPTSKIFTRRAKNHLVRPPNAGLMPDAPFLTSLAFAHCTIMPGRHGAR